MHEQWTLYHGDLLRYSMSLTRDLSRAEDAVQETYVRLMREEPAKLEGRLKPWLFRVCRSRVLDMVRKEGRIQLGETPWMENQADPAPTPAQSATTHERSRQLLDCVSQLPSLQQEAIRLKFQGGLSYREIAEVMGKSVSHVGVLIHQGLAKLRQVLSQSNNSFPAVEKEP